MLSIAKAGFGGGFQGSSTGGVSADVNNRTNISVRYFRELDECDGLLRVQNFTGGEEDGTVWRGGIWDLPFCECG